MTLNEALHRAIGAEPCENACTHYVTGEWSLLGVANVTERAAARAATSAGYDERCGNCGGRMVSSAPGQLTCDSCGAGSPSAPDAAQDGLCICGHAGSTHVVGILDGGHGCFLCECAAFDQKMRYAGDDGTAALYEPVSVGDVADEPDAFLSRVALVEKLIEREQESPLLSPYGLARAIIISLDAKSATSAEHATLLNQLRSEHHYRLYFTYDTKLSQVEAVARHRHEYPDCLICTMLLSAGSQQTEGDE